jgi:hypothetical protein
MGLSAAIAQFRVRLVLKGISIPVLIYLISIVEYLNIDIWILVGLDSAFGKIDTKAEMEYLNTESREFVVYAHGSIISTTPRLLA